MSEPIAPGATEKSALRNAALARRDGLQPQFRAEASRAIAARALPLLNVPTAAVVSSYWPIRSEVDPRELMEAARRKGLLVALPGLSQGGALSFREWGAGAPLLPAGFGTSEPHPQAKELTPDIMIVPLAGFDRVGHRIGYGKGYYDRAIAALSEKAVRPLLIGLGFSVQEVSRVPAEPHDMRLDLIVTERETLDFRKGPRP